VTGAYKRHVAGRHFELKRGAGFELEVIERGRVVFVGTPNEVGGWLAAGCPDEAPENPKSPWHDGKGRSATGC